MIDTGTLAADRGGVIGRGAGIDSARWRVSRAASAFRGSAPSPARRMPAHRDRDYSWPMTAGASVESRWPPIFWDVAPVAALVVVGLVTVEPGRGRDLPLQYLVVVPLLVRRRWPIAVFVLVGILSALTSVQTATPLVQVGAVALASFTVGERSVDRIRGGLVVLLVAALISLALIAQDADAVEALVFPFIVLVPGVAARRHRPAAAARRDRPRRGQRARAPRGG